MFNVGDNVQIQGCSTKKRILETSSGCDSFDTLCGGSLFNSSIILIDEPQSRHFSSYLVRYFVAEGIFNNHKVFVADPVSDVEKTLLKSIPVRKPESSKNLNEFSSSIPLPPSQSNEDMKIAWRYGNVAKIDSTLGSSSKIENLYDFTNYVENPNVEVFNSATKTANFSLKRLYEKIVEIIKEDEMHTKTEKRGPKKNLLRIVLQNIDSDLWEDSEDLPKFLVLLRSLLRSSYAIAYLTTNSYASTEETWRKIEWVADTHVQLIGFDEKEKKSFRHLGNVHGYFRLKQLPRLASVGTHCPPILDLIFDAQSRKGFQIRIMHLPPALNEPLSSQNDQKSLGGCKIDF